MGRETKITGGGVGIPPSPESQRPTPTREDISASAIRASASGFGYLSYLLQGRYHDLDGSGQNISESNDTVVMASVPPGDSYNSDHYAKEPGEPRSRSDAELLAATMELRGEMRDAVSCEYSWYNPDGGEMFSGSTSLSDPSSEGYSYWEYAYFYTWVGRDFSQADSAEILDTGQYEVEFDTNYGTYTRTFDVTGPSVTSCSMPGQAPAGGGTMELEATVSNADGSAHSGEVRWVYDDDRRDVIASEPFTVGPQGAEIVSTSVQTNDVALPADVAAYCLV